MVAEVPDRGSDGTSQLDAADAHAVRFGECGLQPLVALADRENKPMRTWSIDDGFPVLGGGRPDPAR